MNRLSLFVGAALFVGASGAAAQVMDITGGKLPSSPNPTQDRFAAGNFPPLAVPLSQNVPGAHIQDVWNDAQPSAGVLEISWRPSESVRGRLREGMVSTVILPPADALVDYSLGDTVNFAVKPVQDQKNKLWVWLKNPGYDTNLNIIGKSGAVYTFYLRGETWNSKNISHQVIRLSGNSQPSFAEKEEKPTTVPGIGARAQNVVEQLAGQLPDLPPEWLQKGCRYDPTRIRHDRAMSASGNANSEQIAPEIVFRDDCFTYLYWGDNADARKWPGFWQVIDDVDQPVKFEASVDGRYTIVFSTYPLTLRDGERAVCISGKK